MFHCRFDIISVLFVGIMLYCLIGVNISHGSGVEALQDFMADQVLQLIYEVEGIGKLASWINILEHPEIIIYKCIGYFAGVILVLQGLLAQHRFFHKIPIQIASISSIIGVLLFVLSFTPILDFIASLLSII